MKNRPLGDVMQKLLFTILVLVLPNLVNGQWAGSWSYTGSMFVERQQHVTILLPSGEVLVTGGWPGSAIGETYNYSTGEWLCSSTLNQMRYNHRMVLLQDGRSMVMGGSDMYNNRLASCELSFYEHWIYTDSLNTARYCFTATVLLSGKVLVTGGNNSSYLSSCELYDPINKTWSYTDPLHSKRFGHTATLLPSGKVLVCGGVNGYTTLSSCELYDPETQTWSYTGSMNIPRWSHTATLLPSGKVLVVGGGGNSGPPFTSCELYDPESGTWQYTGSMSEARRAHCAALLPDGRVVAAGGYSGPGGHALSSTEIYNPDNGIWITANSLNIARFWFELTTLPSGKVLAVGGYAVYGQPSPGKICELFDPGPYIKIISPNGGGSFEPNDTCNITWVATDNVGVDSISILYSIDAGINWDTVATGEPNDSAYEWIIPDTPSESCLVKILAYDPSLNIGEDQSDSLFSIGLSGIEKNISTPISSPFFQCTPNPFKEKTEITFSIGHPDRRTHSSYGTESAEGIELKIYDVSGRMVKEFLLLTAYSIVPTVISWDGTDDFGKKLPAGVYFVHFIAHLVGETDEYKRIEKAILLR